MALSWPVRVDLCVLHQMSQNKEFYQRDPDGVGRRLGHGQRQPPPRPAPELEAASATASDNQPRNHSQRRSVRKAKNPKHSL